MADNFAALLRDAGTKLENFDFGSAAALYREAMQLRPDNAAAAMGLAMTCNRTGQPAEALKLLGRIWPSMAKAKGKTLATAKAAVLAQIGLAQQQLGHLADALQSFRQAHELAATAELADRIQALLAAVERPEPLEQLLAQARQALQAGQPDEAIKVFRAALQLNADHPPALHGLALALRAKREYAAALPLLQQAIILVPERHDYYNDLGMLFQDMGELRKAISFHNRALKLKPDFAPAYLNLGVAHKRLEEFDRAISSYRKAVELRPDMPEAHNNLGNLLRIQGDLTGARAELERALALRPDYDDAGRNLAAVEQLIGQRPVRAKPAAKAKTGARGKPVPSMPTQTPARKTAARKAGK